jgi:hypothetical protein
VKMVSINLSIDFGGSGIKAIASTEDNIYAFRIAPEIIKMTGEPPRLSGAFKIDLTQNMWVGCGEERYAVGLLARTGYLAPIPLVAPKLDYVIPRTLAATAAAMAKFEVAKCDLNLQLLFPSAEFERTDTMALIRSLKATLSNFDTPTGTLKVKLRTFDGLPEGFGLTKRFLSINPECLSNQAACIMFGHRNTSLYVCVGGQPQHYRTNSKGFARAIEYAKLDPLEGLQDPSLVDEDSIDKYWLANKTWLIENLPTTASIAIVGGGPLAVIGDRVSEFLNSRLPQRQERTQWKHDSATISSGGMPLSKYEENNWQQDPQFPLLTAWPEGIGITEEDKRPFADVYCLWATNETEKRAFNKVSDSSIKLI